MPAQDNFDPAQWMKPKPGQTPAEALMEAAREAVKSGQIQNNALAGSANQILAVDGYGKTTMVAACSQCGGIISHKIDCPNWKCPAAGCNRKRFHQGNHSASFCLTCEGGHPSFACNGDPAHDDGSLLLACSPSCSLRRGHGGPCYSISVSTWKRQPFSMWKRAESLDDIERVTGTEAIVAYKRAWLDFSDNTVKLTGPVYTQAVYAVEMDSICHGISSAEVKEEHTFDPRCRCGFYALKDYDKARNAYNGNCTLQVELSGTVLEAKIGYRASHQRVVRVYIDNQRVGRCAGWMCHSPARYMGLKDVDQDTMDEVDLTSLVPLCADHFKGYDPLRRIALADLRGVLGGIEVEWDARALNDL